MGEAPAEVWLRPTVTGTYYHTSLHDEPDAVRYVRGDLYDKRMVENVNQEPLGELGKASWQAPPSSELKVP